MSVQRRRLLQMLSYVFGASVLPFRNRFTYAAQDPAQPTTPAAPAKSESSQERKSTMSQQGRVLGIGGIFFKSENKQQMKEWYGKHLGLADTGHGVMLPWREKDHPENEQMTIWSIFPSTTKYFEPSQASFMLNYIVDDLDALLARLAQEGVRIDPKRQDESYGRFAWIYDPDGNKIELWQPIHSSK
jgi:catechol 2,3-dioxygenase-like lactoylglutathione lyase family enzyme